MLYSLLHRSKPNKKTAFPSLFLEKEAGNAVFFNQLAPILIGAFGYF